MGILSTIRSWLGVEEGDRRRASDAGTRVAVEREPATETESVVKGVGTEREGREAPSPADEPDVAEAQAPDGESVDVIKGIGAAYAERLAEAGVHSVEDLAAADADDLAAETGLGAGRIETWIAQAEARTR